MEDCQYLHLGRWINCTIDINPKYFYPQPKVWSTLLTLTPKLNFQKLNKIKNLEHITNIFRERRK